jgi:hypothetical protein
MVENFLPEWEVEDLVGFAERNLSSDPRRGGVRNLLSHPKMRELAESSVNWQNPAYCEVRCRRYWGAMRG